MGRLNKTTVSSQYHQVKYILNLYPYSRYPSHRHQWGLGCFINYTLQKKKRCNTSTHPSRVYINQIWKNFFPKTSLEGLATWSKKVTQGSLFVAKTYFLIIIQPLWIPSGVYINQIWKNFFPKTSLEGLATWSKKAKIDQIRRGGRMTVAWSFSNE